MTIIIMVLTFVFPYQGLAKTAFDMVNVREQRQASNQSVDVPPTHQPADLREGIVNAYNVVSTVGEKKLYSKIQN